MSEDFGTVNVRRGDRAREIEALRQRYRNHREMLSRLAADAPNEQLAGEYQRLCVSIDSSMRKLEELEHRPSSSALPGTVPSLPDTRRNSAGTQPLVNSPDAGDSFDPMEDGTLVSPGATSRVLLIVIVGVVLLGLIGWLIWRASSDRKGPAAIIERSSTTGVVPEATASQDVTPVVEQESPAGLKVKPATADYGTIRKGTRAVRQFEVTNVSDTPLTLVVSRSTCRCLYYDYHAKVAAKGHETITVTVDGARAKAGTLEEQVTVRTKENAAIGATLVIHALIK